jgi:site-specific DNA-methyltransferase (adenine-specific)
MISLNTIYNEINIVTMKKMDNESIDGIITSPPYNYSKKRKDNYYNTGYSEIDNLTSDDYLRVRTNEFKEFSRILKKRGVICYNLSYMHENPILPSLLVTKVHEETNLTLADVVYWKKSNSIPFQTSPNKLSRIVEPIYVFVHKENLSDFKANKEVSKTNEKTGQSFYKKYDNFIEAKNNDGFKSTLKAVYSIELIQKLINIYFPNGSVVYDPFMGSGTTALACLENNILYIGSEMKIEHFESSLERISFYKKKYVLDTSN